VFQFDSSKIASYRAITASRLGLPGLASGAFDQASTSARSPKQAAVVAVEQARALAAGGHLEQACALAVAAYDVSGTYHSERVRHAVREFRAGLGTRSPQRITGELDARLHSAYATGST
jgi:hypothetical protein